MEETGRRATMGMGETVEEETGQRVTMEEKVEAADTLIKFFGDDLVKTKCGEVLELVPSVIRAAQSAGVDCVDFVGAAKELQKAGEEQRISSIVRLLDASNALQQSARSCVDSIRCSAARLANTCSDFQKAVEAIEASRKEQQQRRQMGVAHGWTTALWSFVHRRERNPPNDEEVGLQPQVVDAIALTIPLLGQERKMQEMVSLLLVQASNVLEEANDARINCNELSSAIDMLKDAADDEGRLAFIVKLGTAATTMQGATSGSLDALHDHAADLTQACGELKQVIEAMDTVRCAAAHQRNQRGTCSWRSWLWRGSRQEAIGAQDSPEGNNWSSSCSSMQGCGLLGALTILPYLGGTNGILKQYSSCYQQFVGGIFASVWLAVGLGAPCLMLRRPFLQLIARILARVGMLGVTLLVIYYCHWVLAPCWTHQLWILVGLAVGLHIVLFIWACIDGDI